MAEQCFDQRRGFGRQGQGLIGASAPLNAHFDPVAFAKLAKAAGLLAIFIGQLDKSQYLRGHGGHSFRR
jgi:hypothetical protein